MAKRHLLLVDGDPRSLRVMEVSLRKAGFTVTTAADGNEALAHCRRTAPDLVISETKMPDVDGFELRRRLSEDPRLKDVPFVFLTTQKGVEYKVAGVELGAADYLEKPIYVRQVVTRVNMLLDRRDHDRLVHRGERAGFSGSLADLGLVDLVQTLEAGGKTGALTLRHPSGRTAAMWLDGGRIVDCEDGPLSGERAFHRLLHWTEGEFSFEFEEARRPARIRIATGALLAEGLRRLDEWGRLSEVLPGPGQRLSIDFRLLSERLAELPDEVNGFLKVIDGQRTMQDLLDEADADELVAAPVLSKLWSEGIMRADEADALDDDRPAPAEPTPESGAPAFATVTAVAPPLPLRLASTAAPGPAPAGPAPLPLTNPASAPPAPALTAVAAAPVEVAREREAPFQVIPARPSAPRIIRFPAKRRVGPPPQPGPADSVATGGPSGAAGAVTAERGAADPASADDLGGAAVTPAAPGEPVTAGIRTRLPDPPAPATTPLPEPARAAPAARDGGVAPATPRLEVPPRSYAGRVPSERRAASRNLVLGAAAVAGLLVAVKLISSRPHPTRPPGVAPASAGAGVVTDDGRAELAAAPVASGPASATAGGASTRAPRSAGAGAQPGAAAERTRAGAEARPAPGTAGAARPAPVKDAPPARPPRAPARTTAAAPARRAPKKAAPAPAAAPSAPERSVAGPQQQAVALAPTSAAPPAGAVADPGDAAAESAATGPAAAPAPAAAPDSVEPQPPAASTAHPVASAPAPAPARPEAAAAPVPPARPATEQAEEAHVAGEEAARAKAYQAAYRAAVAKYQAGETAGAVAEFRRALQVRETSAALVGLGRALYDDRQPGPALDALRKAVQLDGKNADAYMAMGEVYLRENRRAEARRAYERYLAVAPAGVNVDEVRALLDERLK